MITNHHQQQMQLIVNQAADADGAFIELRELACLEYGSAAVAYRYGFDLLKQRFTEAQSMDAIHCMALFEEDDDDMEVAQQAKAFISHFEEWRGEDKFIADLMEYGLAGYRSSNLLYLAHRCQKSHSKAYQVSRFVAGMGVCGDSTHDTPEQILAFGVAGAGIPYSAQYIAYADIFSLEDEFKADSYSGQGRH